MLTYSSNWAADMSMSVSLNSYGMFLGERGEGKERGWSRGGEGREQVLGFTG